MGEPRLELITAHNSVLLLVDYQPTMFKGVGSCDRNGIANSAIAAPSARSVPALDGLASRQRYLCLSLARE
jgi:nicotinamidase-related amidase